MYENTGENGHSQLVDHMEDIEMLPANNQAICELDEDLFEQQNDQEAFVPPINSTVENENEKEKPAPKKINSYNPYLDSISNITDKNKNIDFEYQLDNVQDVATSQILVKQFKHTKLKQGKI